MEAARSSETLVSYHITWYHNPKDHDFNLHQCGNFKSHNWSPRF